MKGGSNVALLLEDFMVQMTTLGTACVPNRVHIVLNVLYCKQLANIKR